MICSFLYVLFVLVHGGNVELMFCVIVWLRVEFCDVVVFFLWWDGDVYVGCMEMLVQFALCLYTVDVVCAVWGNVQPFVEFMFVLRLGGVLVVSLFGVLGDVIGVSAVEGCLLLNRLTDDFFVYVDGWWV